MVQYVNRIHNVHVKPRDALAVSANILIFSLIYTIAGAFLSYIFYYTFDSYDPEKGDVNGWEKKGMLFQAGDIIVEIALISLTAFWLVHYINTSTPIIPVRSGLEDFIDSYTSGLFFLFTIFIFLDDLSNKLKYVFHQLLDKVFDRYFPAAGSILDGTLHYSPAQRKKINSAFLGNV
jgi:hypothetical protein